jgi:hypothetical protein
MNTVQPKKYRNMRTGEIVTEVPILEMAYFVEVVEDKQ